MTESELQAENERLKAENERLRAEVKRVMALSKTVSEMLGERSRQYFELKRKIKLSGGWEDVR